MARSILIFPIKQYSERVPGKNFTFVDGVPLYQIATIKALRTGVFDKVVIDTDSDEIWEWGQSNGFEMLRRLPELAANNANGNSLLRYHVATYAGYDYYWQGFVTAPFIKQSTIGLLSVLIQNWPHDSFMTVKTLRGHFWSPENQPLYRPDMLPRSQDMSPLYQEVSGFFGISREAFFETRCRVGTNPGFYELSREECLDIDWPSDVPTKKPSQQAPSVERAERTTR